MAGALTPRFDVANLDQWGRLIKSWATHLDYVSETYQDQPPRDYWTKPEPGNGPATETTTDKDASGNPLPWCLPQMESVNIPRPDGTTVALPSAVALTADEFLARLASAGVVVVTMPVQYKNVLVIQGSVDTMIIRLPPKDTLQGSEDDLLNGLGYPFRGFYATYYGTAPTIPTDQAGIMLLHANRIGEYTLNNCN